jgi:hypothetical protein
MAVRTFRIADRTLWIAVRVFRIAVQVFRIAVRSVRQRRGLSPPPVESIKKRETSDHFWGEILAFFRFSPALPSFPFPIPEQTPRSARGPLRRGINSSRPEATMNVRISE